MNEIEKCSSYVKGEGGRSAGVASLMQGSNIECILVVDRIWSRGFLPEKGKTRDMTRS
jgi:hypothetical protein